MLAASLAGFKQVAEKGYDAEELSKYLDLVNINTYDYHGFWDKKTGHHSPMRESGSRDMVINISYELQHYFFRNIESICKKLSSSQTFPGQHIKILRTTGVQEVAIKHRSTLVRTDISTFKSSITWYECSFFRSWYGRGVYKSARNVKLHGNMQKR